MPKTFATIEFAHLGGSQLRAWFSAWFYVVNVCIDWFLGRFNNKLCIKMHTANIVLNLLPCEVKGVLVNLITPHLILQENLFSAKSSSPSRGEECWELVLPMNNLCRCWFRN